MIHQSPHPAGDALVRKLDSIASLSDEERQAVRELPAIVRTLKRGQDIVLDGDRPSHCCLVVEGWAFRYKIVGDAKRQILSFHIPGEMPDLHSLYLPVMDHGLCTLTGAKLAFIPHQSIRDLGARFPGVAAALWRDVLIDAAIFREWLTGMGQRPAYERIAHLFCELYMRLAALGLAGDYQCPMPITQADLADALGLTNVHVNRNLQDLRANGMITLRRGLLVIDDWDGLRQVSGFDPTYLHLKRAAA